MSPPQVPAPPVAAGVGVSGAVQPVLGPQRPPLVRPAQGRVLGGVAVGLAAHLGLTVRQARVALVGASMLGGSGIVLYAWVWAFAPSAAVAPTGPAPDGTAPSGQVASPAAVNGPDRGPRIAHLPAPARIGDLLIGALLLLAGLSLLGTRLGWAINPGLALPVIVVLGGAVLAYTQLDEVERTRWSTRTGMGSRVAVLRVVGGLVLVLVGVLLVVVERTDVASASRVLVAVVAVLGGASIVLAPWAVRLWRDLATERAASAREAERADIAAHLHDSVLQTLALIQRHSADPAQVSRLARAQERDLRDYLYGRRPAGDPASGEATLAGQVAALVADVEDRYAVAIDLVMVGDRPLDERGGALVAALREAMVNAARHAGTPVQVYVEAGADGVEAFVRDRGPGFDPARVPPDRLGVRESIIGRMERHGGTAVLRTRPRTGPQTGSQTDDDAGTEVRLAMPDPEQEQP